MLSVNIKKQLDNFLLDVSFETDKETMALLGASGCGKSMTLKCIAGIVKPDSGRIVLNDRVLYDSEKHINLSPQERRVGYLFQQYALFPNMTVEKNIAAGCRVKDRAKRKELVAEKIKAMHLEGLEHKRPAQLSGGQQQRVALARILINEPELLLLDEPFSALDSYLKWQLELELSDTLVEYGQGALYVSHSRDEVYRICDSVCVLRSGHSEKKQLVRELFENPVTIAAAELSGCKNFSHAKLTGDGKIEAFDWGVVLTPSDGADTSTEYVGIQEHAVQLSAQPSAVNSFPCRIQRVIDDVFTNVIIVSIAQAPGFHEYIRVELPKNKWCELSKESTLYAIIDPNSLMHLKNC